MSRDHLLGFPAIAALGAELRQLRITPSRPRLSAAEQERRRQMDAPGWQDWQGGGCPVPQSAMVEFSQRDGAIGRAYACTLLWINVGGVSDIVAFRALPDDVVTQ